MYGILKSFMYEFYNDTQYKCILIVKEDMFLLQIMFHKIMKIIKAYNNEKHFYRYSNSTLSVLHCVKKICVVIQIILSLNYLRRTQANDTRENILLLKTEL